MICGIMANQGGASACAYPMDGSDAEVLARMATSLGVTGKATTSEQMVSHVFSGTTCNLGAINSLETTFDPTVVGKAFEVELTIPTLETTSEAEIYLYVYQKSDDVGGFIRQSIAHKLSGEVFKSFGNEVVTGDRIGFYLDPTPDTGGWRYYLNGVDVDGVSGATVAYTDLCIGFRIEVTATSALDIGDTIAAELISSASDMTGTYPLGTTDICGTPL